MEVDYPLDDEYVFDVEAPSSRGFTRASLAQAVADLYAHIYAREEATSTVATGKVPGLLNRNATTGGLHLSRQACGDQGPPIPSGCAHLMNGSSC